MNLRDLCFHLRKRRRMYLLDDRFSTAVAFVEGYNTALDGGPLSGFHKYVTTQVLNRESSLHWSYLIASTKVPEILNDGISIDQLPSKLDIELTERMIDLLESYLAASSSSEVSE